MLWVFALSSLYKFSALESHDPHFYFLTLIEAVNKAILDIENRINTTKTKEQLKWPEEQGTWTVNNNKKHQKNVNISHQ